MCKLVKFGCMLIALLGFAITATAYEGYAPIPTGGAGGITKHVTNLNDSGAGSFRQAVTDLNGVPATIVFDVNGVICTSSETRITKPNVTVDGTTAPGNGITIAANTMAAEPPLGIEANNVIVSNLRIRQIAAGNASECIIIWNGSGIVIDHCSMTNAGDSSIAVTDNGQNHIIVSRCLFGSDVEAFRAHASYVSCHHCLFSTDNRRQPRIYGTTGPWDLRNIMVDNWTNTGTNVLLASNVNVINNYYGNPNALSDCNSGFLGGSIATDTNVYINGNYSECGQNIDGYTQLSSPVTEPNVTTEDACSVPADVLSNVGAQPTDAIDQYYIDGGGLNPPILNASCSAGSGGTPPVWSINGTYYVDGISGNDNNAGTASAPWATIAKAASKAGSGNTVVVWGSQTYSCGSVTFSNSGTATHPITFVRDPASDEAILDGGGTTSGVFYTTKCDYVVIDGFTIQNGKYGIYGYGSGATYNTIKDCRITGNTSHGVYIRSGQNWTLFNDCIYDNSSSGYGVYAYDSATGLSVTQCVIYQQKSGLYCNTGSCTATVLNSIINNNTVYGIYAGSGSTVTITYTDNYGNGTNYSGCSAGTGCISSNPKFVDPSDGNFALHGGPCVGTASDGGNMGYRSSDEAL